ncbi:MAG: TonB-dependent receptor [Chitinophagaceae bacterium]|nr:MAG: TonB-dependent receptor [Chitinophagaceae bacterium]
MQIRLLAWQRKPVSPANRRSYRQLHRLLFFGFLFLLSATARAQTVTGRVLSGDSAVTGATVTVKGTGTATQTNETGNFTLSASPGNTLVVSHVSYVSQEVQVPERGVVTVILRPTVTQSMNEIVVVGYGTQRRSDMTGSVASVPKSRFTQLPVTNVLQAIQGTVPGVIINTPSQVPGRTASVQIRGINSIGARISPLIVVDGIPLAPDASTNDINASDIASMEILKDASAVAPYGVRGSNGVILITTKRGSSGKPVIRYNVYTGVENIINALNPSSPERFVQKYADYKAQNNINNSNVLPNLTERDNYAAGRTINWIDQVTQTGRLTDHNVSISGGTQDARYYISGEYLKQDGAVRGYQYQRINLRSNLDVNITNWLSVGTSFFFNNNNTDGGRANFWLGFTMSPYGSLNDANGNYALYPMAPELLYKNPLLGLKNDRMERNNNITGTGYVEIKPAFLAGLKYRMNVSYSMVRSRFGYYEGRAFDNQLGRAETFNSESKYWIISNILSYNKEWGVHRVDLTGLFEAQSKIYSSNNANATGFINDLLSYHNLGAGAVQSSSSFQDGQNSLSQMGRINYSYDSRYLLTVTARRDGSSVFGANTSKYGVFPTVALGWNLHNEAFMRGVTAINSLKLRGSYGKTGNEAVTINRTQTTASTVRFPFNGVSAIGVLANNLGNADLRWEETKGLNVGIDFSLFKNRISGTVEGWRTTTEDIILNRSLPIITGYSSILDNLGKLQNTGFEFSLNTQNFNGSAFRWETDPSAKPGYIKFRDLNKDGKIDANDRSILGSRLPDWTGGITNTFHYKDFHLSVFIQTSQGGLRNNGIYSYADEGWRINLPSEIDYWTPTNPINDRPSFSDGALGHYRSLGYGFPKDASYTRIKDVTFSYTMPQSILGKLKLASLTLYASGRNLHTFTDWVGWDPEQDYTFRGSGDWENNYPPVRSFVFGANITLR